MKNCANNGHKYFPAVRRVITNSWLGPITTTEENILYCSRCGHVKGLDVHTAPYKTTDYGTFTWSTGTTTSSGWMYLNSSEPSGDPL